MHARRSRIFSTEQECNLVSGVARGDSCPRAPPGGGRQNPAKEFKKNYILRNFLKSEKYNENVVIIF